MMYIDLLMVIAVMMLLMFGAGDMSIQEVMAFGALGVCAIIALHFFLAWFFERATLGWTSHDKRRMSTRRRMIKDKVMRTRQEKALEELDDEALRRHVEEHPREALAVEILCERLKRQGRTADYARELEYLLTLKSDLVLEEKCKRYHELADLYLGPLRRPDRARELLHTLIATFPRHYQATLARQRLERLGPAARPGPTALDSGEPTR